MRQFNLRFNVWPLMVAVMVVALFCTAARLEEDRKAGIIIVGSCILILAYKYCFPQFETRDDVMTNLRQVKGH